MPVVKKPLVVAAKVATPVVRKAGPVDIPLPDEPKPKETDITKYTLLLYGREKIGKTTALASFPGAIFFSTEPGSKGLEIFDYNHENGGVKDWEVFRAGVRALIANPSKFKTVIIDTVDRAYDMCLDWVCEHKGIEYPGTDASGKEDFGKSWRAVKQEFVEQIHALAQAGLGICFTSHCTETEFKTRSGDKFTRIQPSMSGQARKVIEAMVDLFFYAEYMRTPEGANQRVVICQGDETIWAGARETVAEEFPAFLPLQKRDWFDVVQGAFNGEYHGLDAKTLLPAKGTMKTTAEFLGRARTKATAEAGANGAAQAVRKVVKRV